MKQSIFARVYRLSLSPMQSKIFRMSWTVNVVSCIGTQLHHVNEKLQMGHLTTSPFWMSCIEASSSLSIMLLGVAAGVVADRMDRRKLLIITHAFMLACAATLSGLTFFGLTTPKILISAAFLIGTGTALSMPAYQAIVPELVEDENLLPQGVSLNSAGYNMSRIVGPFAGGCIFAAFGAHWAFLINALSFLGIIVALVMWKRYPTKTPHVCVNESFWVAMCSGLSSVCQSKHFSIAVVWALGYGWFGGVSFSLLPSLIIHNMKASPVIFGLLVSCLGIGAVIITFFLPFLRSRFKTNVILVVFGIFAAASQAVLSWTNSTIIIGICLVVAGMSWLSIMSTVNISIHLSFSDWMKARAFGVYYMFWGAATSLGATFWGRLATRVGVRVAFGYSAIGMLLILAILSRVKITTLDSKYKLAI